MILIASPPIIIIPFQGLIRNLGAVGEVDRAFKKVASPSMWRALCMKSNLTGYLSSWFAGGKLTPEFFEPWESFAWFHQADLILLVGAVRVVSWVLISFRHESYLGAPPVSKLKSVELCICLSELLKLG